MPLSFIDVGQFFGNAASILVLVLGFGFVIFFHELGHFLAAKWVGIKVEQFAVGFGQAILSWRKGIGFRVGNTQKEYQARLDQYVLQRHGNDAEFKDKTSEAYEKALIEAEEELGLGETEYRLNWLPLGGYVKMLGQDDLRPNATAEDPRSFNRKPIWARMVVVSAGVVMNVILAGIGFMVLFMYGFRVAPPQVGTIASGSPAQYAVTVDGKHRPLQVGDVILDFEGKPQEDFTKIGLNTALSADGQPQPMKVKHLDGKIEKVLVTPRVDPMAANFLAIGIGPPQLLEGVDRKLAGQLDPELLKLQIRDVGAVKPGEVITQIDGHDVKPDQFWKLDAAVQAPGGKPVELTVRNEAGKLEHRLVQPHFDHLFAGKELNFAGMLPRPMVESVERNSSARGKVMPGDVVLSVSVGSDETDNPSSERLRDCLAKAGAGHTKVTLVVLRGGKTIKIEGLEPNVTVDRAKGVRGLGIGLIYDDLHAVVAGVADHSPAEEARIPAGVTLTAINGQKVSNWFDVQRLLGQGAANEPIAISYVGDAGKATTKLAVDADQLFAISHLRRISFLVLRDDNIVRKAASPLQAAYWGVTETRDFILQFYLTLRRMVAGSVSPNQLMGPLGIFVGGARFAFKGWDWLLWFLSMISANLAVVNFLPIPIVDGGLFTFLVLEKIKGRPLSARTQLIAQYVGLAFLAGVFLFVTYHDLLRFTGFGS